MSVERRTLGELADGTLIEEVALRNERLGCRFATHGATLLSLEVPDRQGDPGEVVLGFDDLASRLERDDAYLGGTVGRFANRIAASRFEDQGRVHRLLPNEGEHHLHGGPSGFDKRIWTLDVPDPDGTAVHFELRSEDGDQGYPGELRVRLECSLDGGDLRLRTTAETTARTPLSITHHGYFNLADGGRTPVLDHELRIPAAFYTPVDEELIPTGEIAPVEGTPFDLRDDGGKAPTLREAMAKLGGGFDHNFVVAGKPGVLRPCAQLRDPGSGRVLEVLTTHAGVQFYGGNFLAGIEGRGGVRYEKHHGFCVEPQHFPDSVNRTAFPSPYLDPGQLYDHSVVYRFSAS